LDSLVDYNFDLINNFQKASVAKHHPAGPPHPPLYKLAAIEFGEHLSVSAITPQNRRVWKVRCGNMLVTLALLINPSYTYMLQHIGYSIELWRPGHVG